jgi:hypothetical protein
MPNKIVARRHDISSHGKPATSKVPPDNAHEALSRMSTQPAYLYSLIIGCEATFWLLLALALAARYLLKRNRLSQALLLALPVVDILLLAFTALDLRAGTPATFAHGLATAYVGFTLAFGPVVVEWTDQRFAHWFANGPRPVGAPCGWPATKHELALWLRCIVAWAIAIALLIALIADVDNEALTRALHGWFRIAFGSIIIWFVFGPVRSLLCFLPRAAK